MTDLETRLAVALREASEDRPTVADLAAGARRRLRRRRRTTAAAAAAVMVVVALPMGLLFSLPGSEPEVTTVVPDGWRTESFRDLTLRVPRDWSYEGGPDWCLDRPALTEAQPAVTRPEGFTADASCSPRLGYGVTFGEGPGTEGPPPRGLPADSFVGLVRSPGAHAWIATESASQLEQIEVSARTIDRLDPHGCPPVVDPDARGTGKRVSVCRYDSGELEQSELLSVQGSRALSRAVAAAPYAAGYDPVCPPYSYRQPVITLRSAAVTVDILPSTSCPLASVLMAGTTERLLTEDVLYWALSPGTSLGAADDLPLPEEPRTLD